MSIELLIIVIIVFERYPGTYNLMQGIVSCVVCSNL